MFAKSIAAMGRSHGHLGESDCPLINAHGSHF